MIVFQLNVIKVKKKHNRGRSYIGVARIFDWWEMPKCKSHAMTSSKFVEKRDFVLDEDAVELENRAWVGM